MSKFAKETRRWWSSLWSYRLQGKSFLHKDENFPGVTKLSLHVCWWIRSPKAARRASNFHEQTKKRTNSTREHHEFSSGKKKVWWKVLQNESQIDTGGEKFRFFCDLVKNRKMLSENIFYCNSATGEERKKIETAKTEEHTSEHEALIRAAGRQLEGKIDSTFYCLTFTSESKMKGEEKVFKKFSSAFGLTGAHRKSENFKWWTREIYLSESWENSAGYRCEGKGRKRFALLVCEKMWKCELTVAPVLRSYTAETFSHRWAQFRLYKIIHLPVRRPAQPIGAQQERKMFFSRGHHPPFSPPTSNRKLSCALQKLSTRFFNFPPVRAFFFSSCSTQPHRSGICVSEQKTQWWKFFALAGKGKKRRRGEKRKSFQQQKKWLARKKNITMIMIDDET